MTLLYTGCFKKDGPVARMGRTIQNKLGLLSKTFS